MASSIPSKANSRIASERLSSSPCTAKLRFDASDMATTCVGKNTESARAAMASWAQPVLQRSQLSTVVHPEWSRTPVTRSDANAFNRDSHPRVPIRGREAAVWTHPEYWSGSLCVSGTAYLLPSFPPHLPPVAAGCVAVRGRRDSRYWCCSTPAGNPSWIRHSSEESQSVRVAYLYAHSAPAAVIALHGYSFTD